MRKISKIIVFLISILILIVLLYPKNYYTYQGINPDPNWKPERCVGINREIINQNPDGPDKICFGFVLK
jgi:hypothetical protein